MWQSEKKIFRLVTMYRSVQNIRDMYSVKDPNLPTFRREDLDNKYMKFINTLAYINGRKLLQLSLIKDTIQQCRKAIKSESEYIKEEYDTCVQYPFAVPETSIGPLFMFTTKYIASGTFGRVYTVMNDDMEFTFALKIEKHRSMFDSEVTLQQKVNELGIAPKVFNAITCIQRTIFGHGLHDFLLMEKMHITLLDRCMILMQTEDIKTFVGTGVTIDHIIRILHEHNICHNDLHASNVMLNLQDRPFFIDFGSSFFVDEQNPHRYESFLYDVHTLWHNLPRKATILRANLKRMGDEYMKQLPKQVTVKYSFEQFEA